MAANDPLRLGELYELEKPEDQEAIDELKRKIEEALASLDARITTLEGA